MRKQLQKQIIELLATIREAQSAGLYADAQDGAFAVREFIKRAEGEGARTAALLEEYCRLLFQADHVEHALQAQLTEIGISVLKDLKSTDIEIVFICYNASMSDSVLSIYQAAKADPNCQAFWLPIPYFEVISDGTIGAMHFDGVNCYGDGIECSDWSKYDMKARHPDIIVTYAPYDEGNYVTRVHPDYFCRYLRELTDLLVYVPYFVSADYLEESLCTVAGCVYAHKVVVQSEQIRDIYIREFKKMFGNQFGRPEDKFIALGSSKFDAALNTRREDIAVRDSWERLIGQGGQGRKKVILYNTSVSSILAGDELYLKKLRHVLDIFRRRDDVVLLWRPHPLSEATFSSMRPRLLDEYEKIVADYKREGWGIFDDSSDIHRAIAISDAYYGDGSSVVPMYGITGKPVVLQHDNMDTTDIYNFSIATESLYDDGKYLWFAAVDFNALFRMDKKTREPEYLGSFPKADISVDRISSRVVCHNKKLYFSPFNGLEFYVYDIDKKAFETIEIPECLSNAIKTSEFISIAAYKQYIFYIGYTYRGIVKYDCGSGNVQCYDNWVDELDQLIGERNKIYFICAYPKDNKLYCPCVYTKAVLIFDMDTCEYEMIRLNSKAEGFRSIAYCKESFWLASAFDSKYLIEWDGKGAEVIEHKSPQAENDRLWDAIAANGKVWFLPSTSNTSFRVNGDVIENVDELCNMHPNKCAMEWLRYTVAGEWIYLHKKGEYENSLMIFNTVTLELREEKLQLNDEQCGIIEPLLKQAFRDRINQCQTWKDCVIDESFVNNLNAYIDFVIYDGDTPEAQTFHDRQVELFQQITANSDGTAGQAIYNYIKKLTLGQETRL